MITVLTNIANAPFKLNQECGNWKWRWSFVSDPFEITIVQRSRDVWISFYVACIYVWVYENGAKELKSRPKRAFFLAITSKVDDIKSKTKVSPFFFPLPVYLPFIALLSLFLCPFSWLEEGLKV